MMRRTLALLLPLLALTACGGGGADNAGNAANNVTVSVPHPPEGPLPPSASANMAATGNIAAIREQPAPNSFDRADGSLDRARYRTWILGSCTLSISTGNPEATRPDVDRFCGCAVDRIVEVSSDTELRAMLGRTEDDRRFTSRRMGEAMAHCGDAPGRAG